MALNFIAWMLHVVGSNFCPKVMLCCSCHALLYSVILGCHICSYLVQTSMVLCFFSHWTLICEHYIINANDEWSLNISTLLQSLSVVKKPWNCTD